MSNLEHVTGAAFVAADEAQYLKWLDGAAGQQKYLEGRINRLLDVIAEYDEMVLCLFEYVDDEGPALRAQRVRLNAAKARLQQLDMAPID